jgi:hypothetical protein
MIVKAEWLVGGLAVVSGGLFFGLLMQQGHGISVAITAVMLMVTGCMSCLLAWQTHEETGVPDRGKIALLVLRRVLLFLNAGLTGLVLFVLLLSLK